MKKKSPTKFFKNLSKNAKIAVLVGIGLLVVAVVGITIFAPSGETTYSVKTSLKEILESSELSTSEYTYNSIAKVLIDNNKPAEEDNIKYQIAYKGNVTSGFDFKGIDIVEKENSIIIIIPKIEIKTLKVDEDMEYIFTKDKYDTESSYVEAYNACCKDLEIKSKANKTLITTAIDSAIETVTAITKPFEKHLKDGKTFKVVYIDDYAKEVK